MKRVSFLIVFSTVIALLTLAIAGNEFGPAFKKCVSQEAVQHSGKTAPNDNQGIALVIATQTVCTLSLIDRHSAFFSFLATLIIAWFTGTLWIATREQGKLTREALGAERRAFLFAAEIVPQWERDNLSGYYNWRIRPRWINSGETASKDLRLYVDSEFRDSLLPEDFVFSERVAPGTGLLGPKAGCLGGAVPHAPDSGLTPLDIAAIRDRKKFFYMWGWVRYFDIFPGTNEHITRFCWQILVSGDPTRFLPGQAGVSDTNLQFGYLHTPRGNCADDECGENRHQA